MPYSLIFFGTSDFSLPSLQALINDKRFDVKAVVTKPDMKVGRHQDVIKPPVKILAEKHGIPVLQLDSIKAESSYDTLKRLQEEERVDSYVVVSYGKIIPQKVLDLPKHGVINVHGSLLPKHRGASCVQSAISSGDKETGVTIMLMDAEMDHGPILDQKKTTIRDDDTGGILHDRLADMGGVILPDTLADFIEHKIEPKEQDHDSATYCKILKREDGKIDWSKPAVEIERLVRAYDPWPGTYTVKDDKRIKIHKAKTSPPEAVAPMAQNSEFRISNSDLGQWIIEDEKLFVTCGDGVLKILELQPEGKRRMSAKDYLAGLKIQN